MTHCHVARRNDLKILIETAYLPFFPITSDDSTCYVNLVGNLYLLFMQTYQYILLNSLTWYKLNNSN